MKNYNYTTKTSADDVSLDSATTIADKNEKLAIESPEKRTLARSALPTLKRPVLSPSAASSAPNCQIRHRYLSKLGVADVKSPKTAPLSKSAMFSKPKLVGILKTSSKQTTTNTKTTAVIKPSVRFHTQDSIHFIPNKSEFTNPQDLWIQKSEFTELFQRNCLEYASDGWKWETATEETDFVFYRNELVHPAHFRGPTCTMQRHFLMSMYAQRKQSEF